MDFRSWLSNSQSISAKAYYPIESFDLPFWQFWRFLLIGSEMDISSSRERFRILIWNIKMPNRCLDPWGRSPIGVACLFAASVDLSVPVTTSLVILAILGTGRPPAHPDPIFDPRACSPWLMRTFPRRIQPVIPSDSYFLAFGNFSPKQAKSSILTSFQKPTVGDLKHTVYAWLKTPYQVLMCPLEIHEDKDLR